MVTKLEPLKLINSLGFEKPKPTRRPKLNDLMNATNSLERLIDNIMYYFDHEKEEIFHDKIFDLANRFDNGEGVFCVLYDDREPCAIGDNSDCPLSISYDPRVAGDPMGCGLKGYNFLSNPSIETLTDMRDQLFHFLSQVQLFGNKPKPEKTLIKLRPKIWVGNVKKPLRDIEQQVNKSPSKDQLSVSEKPLLAKEKPRSKEYRLKCI